MTLYYVSCDQYSRAEVGEMLQSYLHYHIMWGQQMNFLFFALHFLICFMLLEQIMKGLYLSSEKCPAVIFFFLK